MKLDFVRCVGATLALASIPLIVTAQTRRRGDPPPESNSCAAPGANCLFGYSRGCTANCPNGRPVCVGARCILGFPIASRCSCE
jgi:hypothetical protein